jgi:hypothetical protein
MRGKQVVGAHEAQDAIAADLVAGQEMEARMDLAVAFADEGRILDVGADEGEQGIVIERGLGAALGVDFRGGQKGVRRRGGLRVEGRTRKSPRGANAGETVAATGERRDRATHLRDLLAGKGSARAALMRSSSFSMESSPMRRLASMCRPRARWQSR